MHKELVRETAWNILSFQGQHISNLLQKATREFLQGDMTTQFWTLVAIRKFINRDLESTEREELNSKQEKIVYLINELAKVKRKKQNRVLSGMKSSYTDDNSTKIVAELSKNITIYDERLMDILKVLGFFPKKRDSTKLSF